MFPVPLNSSKINSSMRLPVSINAVARIVRLPPSSTLRAEYHDRIPHLGDEPLRGDPCPSGQSGADYFQYMLMTRVRRMQMQMQIAGQDFQLFPGKSLHLV